MILLNEIGGSMGPIYGTIFMDMAEAGEDLDEISAADFAEMLEAGLNGLYGIVDARVGDKDSGGYAVACSGRHEKGGERPDRTLRRPWQR